MRSSIRSRFASQYRSAETNSRSTSSVRKAPLLWPFFGHNASARLADLARLLFGFALRGLLRLGPAVNISEFPFFPIDSLVV